MSDAKIYVGSTEVDYYELVPSGFNHTFLFYDADGNLNTTNDQWVIQAYPSSVNPFTNKLVISNTWAGNDSKLDLDTDNDGLADRNPSDLNLVDITSYFDDGETGWQSLSAHAESLGTYESGVDAYNTGQDYNAFYHNCNTVVNTLLVGAGQVVFRMKTRKASKLLRLRNSGMNYWSGSSGKSCIRHVLASFTIMR